MAAPSTFRKRVEHIRHFNRFYTRQIGLLQQGYLDSPFSLSQVRVLYELAHHPSITAGQLGRQLDLDAGYLSRMLRLFSKRGLLARTTSTDDRRQALLRLTPVGQQVFGPLDARAREEIGTLLGRLGELDQQRLVEAMTTIQRLLDDEAEPRVPYILRPPEAGDLGWVVQRHGALYAEEYHYDVRFEALVASIVAHFVERFDPRRERCWIAEREGQPVGCVFLVRARETTGKLRLFLVEPSARGLGIGQRLIEELLRFARGAGYKRIRLWTQSELLAARHLYARNGFQKVAEEPHDSWSRTGLVSETWELRL